MVQLDVKLQPGWKQLRFCWKYFRQKLKANTSYKVANELRFENTHYKINIFQIQILVEMFQKEVESKLEPRIGRAQLAVHIREGAL